MKILISVVVVVLVAVGLFFMLRDDVSAPGETVSPSPSVSVSVSPTVSPSLSSGPSATMSPSVTPGASVMTVTYTDTGFSPSNVTIKAGQAVTFKNNSSKLMWVASGPHPAHSAYPVKGGCINSAFDQCVGGAINTSWSYTFTAKGSWGYHNHLDSRHFGKITVE